MAGRPVIPATAYARRRRQLMRMAGDDAILVLPAAPERIRSRDTHYPYRQDSDLWYLTGFPEPEAVLVLVPGRAHGEALLFCRERDPDREGWDGPRAGRPRLRGRGRARGRTGSPRRACGRARGRARLRAPETR